MVMRTNDVIEWSFWLRVWGVVQVGLVTFGAAVIGISLSGQWYPDVKTVNPFWVGLLVVLYFLLVYYSLDTTEQAGERRVHDWTIQLYKCAACFGAFGLLAFALGGTYGTPYVVWSLVNAGLAYAATSGLISTKSKTD